jgi:hypothetical protein
MNENTTEAVATFVVPDVYGWKVSCSCGYLVIGLATQQLAQAHMDNHWARCHEPRTP